MKELSKEEILDKHYTPGMNWESVRNGVLAAMDEYAAQKDAEISRLQARVKELEGALKYLMEGAKRLPPYTAEGLTLKDHFEKAKKALNL